MRSIARALRCGRARRARDVGVRACPRSRSGMCARCFSRDPLLREPLSLFRVVPVAVPSGSPLKGVGTTEPPHRYRFPEPLGNRWEPRNQWGSNVLANPFPLVLRLRGGGGSWVPLGGLASACVADGTVLFEILERAHDEF